MARNGNGGKGGKRGGAGALPSLALVGFVLFAASWLVPVVRHQSLLDVVGGITRAFGSSPEAVGAGLGGPDWLPGWSACRFAWQLLVDPQPQGGGEQWKQYLAGSSCLTNLVMLGAFVAALARGRTAVLGAMLLGCTAVDASWVYLGDENTWDQLGAGYWMWLVSFVLAGIGLLRAPRRG
jgi:hypothetical protein